MRKKKKKKKTYHSFRKLFTQKRRQLRNLLTSLHAGGDVSQTGQRAGVCGSFFVCACFCPASLTTFLFDKVPSLQVHQLTHLVRRPVLLHGPPSFAAQRSQELVVITVLRPNTENRKPKMRQGDQKVTPVAEQLCMSSVFTTRLS